MHPLPKSSSWFGCETKDLLVHGYSRLLMSLRTVNAKKNASTRNHSKIGTFQFTYSQLPLLENRELIRTNKHWETSTYNVFQLWEESFYLAKLIFYFHTGDALKILGNHIFSRKNRGTLLSPFMAGRPLLPSLQRTDQNGTVCGDQ
jgi:hypothetical protein